MTQFPDSLSYPPGFADPGAIPQSFFGPGYFNHSTNLNTIQPSDLELTLAPKNLNSNTAGTSSDGRNKNDQQFFDVNPFSLNLIQPQPILFGTPVDKLNSSTPIIGSSQQENMNEIMGLAASLTSPEAHHTNRSWGRYKPWQHNNRSWGRYLVKIHWSLIMKLVREGEGKYKSSMEIIISRHWENQHQFRAVIGGKEKQL